MKHNLLLSLALLVSTAYTVTSQKVSVRLVAPDQVSAGSAIRIDLLISKGAVTGFGRYQQLLPDGFAVKAVETATADFSYEGNKINLIWLTLPGKPEISVSLDITPTPSFTGPLGLEGTLAYLEGTERKEVSSGKKIVMVHPVGVNVPAPASTAPEAQAPASMVREEEFSLGVYRQKPVLSSEGNVYTIHILICAGKLEKFAKLEEQVLPGYEAKVIDAHGAIFSFEAGIAKFLWMKLPPEKLFMVSYELVPTAGAKGGAPVVQGSLSYVMNGEPGVEPVSERNFSIPGTDEASLRSIARSLELSTPAEVPAAQQNIPVATVVQPPAQPVAHPSASGIIFKVQIGAFKAPVDEGVYFKKFNLTDAVEEEVDHGYYKYTVGNFTLYQEAKKAADRISSTTSITQPFIIAYKNGVRIALKEALTLSGQH